MQILTLYRIIERCNARVEAEGECTHHVQWTMKHGIGLLCEEPSPFSLKPLDDIQLF